MAVVGGRSELLCSTRENCHVPVTNDGSIFSRLRERFSSRFATFLVNATLWTGGHVVQRDMRRDEG